jgi:hypothetical protein
MSTVLVWGLQCTLDLSLAAGGRVSAIANGFLEERLFPRFEKELIEIKEGGLSRDYAFRLDDAEGDDPADMERASEYLALAGTLRRQVHIGGNPAVSALRARLLREDGLGQGAWPRSLYGGVLPRTVAEHVEGSIDPILREIFLSDMAKRIDERPQTMAIESASHKLIIDWGRGRTLEPLMDDGTFSSFLDAYESEREARPDDRMVLALSVPHPVHLRAQLIREIRDRFGREITLAIGTSSFRRQGGRIDFDGAQNVYDTILQHADIVSMNELELGDLHTAIVGGGQYSDASLAFKIKELDLDAITVCHSGDGAILHLGSRPHELIRNEEFARNPFEFAQDALRFCVDGAAYCIDSRPTVGRRATEAMVRAYSNSVQIRNEHRFESTFRLPDEHLPAGVITVRSPSVTRPLSQLTGVGAMFDGMLFSVLLRD